MRMKKIVIAIASTALVASSTYVANAAPTTTVMFTAPTGAPLAGNTLPTLTSGDVVTMVIGKFPTGKGMYVYQAVQPAAGKRPTVFNKSGSLWISATPGASFKPSDLIKLTIDNGRAWGADCAYQSCGIQVELDSISSAGDTSEDQFFPFTYVAGTSTTTAAPATPASSTTVTASIDGTTLEQNKASVVLAYRTPLTVVTSASDGTTPTMKFTADPSGKTLCVVEGRTIKAVTATGTCNLEVRTGTSVGYYPFYLGQGTQVVKQKIKKVKRGKPTSLTLKSNFGETIAYQSTSKKICTLVDNTLIGLTPGRCTITATAIGTDNYKEYKAKLGILITK